MTSVETLIALKSLIVITALLIFGLWERLLPFAASPLLLRLGHVTRAGFRRLARNLSLLGINAFLSPLVVVPITVFAEGFSLGLRPGFLAGWPGLLFDLLLLDLWIYWWHRINHEIQWLWRFHQVHHLDETLDISSAVRFHAGEVLLSACVRALVIIVFDISLVSVLLFEALVLVLAIFHHSDARLPAALEKALSSVVVTPAIHWVHHHALRSDTDSNYGTVLSAWDRLFGTKSRTERTPHMPIGVENESDRPLSGLVAAPFGDQARRRIKRPLADPIRP